VTVSSALGERRGVVDAVDGDREGLGAAGVGPAAVIAEVTSTSVLPFALAAGVKVSVPDA
jgi:hypothetical protein